MKRLPASTVAGIIVGGTASLFSGVESGYGFYRARCKQIEEEAEQTFEWYQTEEKKKWVKNQKTCAYIAALGLSVTVELPVFAVVGSMTEGYCHAFKKLLSD